MKLPSFAQALSAAALVTAASVATAQIERLDLRQMVTKADDAVFGTITNKHVIRIEHSVDGPDLYYTILTIEGRSLRDDRNLTVDVAFNGGFIDNIHGVRNSEAPSDDDVQVGNRVVAFYKWVDNLGGGISTNTLYASHGGLYRTIEARKGTIVLGRGETYAIPSNVELPALRTQIRAIPK